jgi:hypothetical protein
MYSKKNYEMFILMFPMIFQNSMNSRKSRCDIPSGTTQGHDCPFWLSL